MLPVLMGICALVTLAAALVAGWLTTSALPDIEQRMAWLEKWQSNITNEMAKRTPTELRAEVDDLRGALDVIRASNRKEFGSLWGRLGGKRDEVGPATVYVPSDDGTFEAMLDLQSRPPGEPK